MCLSRHTALPQVMIGKGQYLSPRMTTLTGIKRSKVYGTQLSFNQRNSYHSYKSETV